MWFTWKDFLALLLKFVQSTRQERGNGKVSPSWFLQRGRDKFVLRFHLKEEKKKHEKVTDGGKFSPIFPSPQSDRKHVLRVLYISIAIAEKRNENCEKLYFVESCLRDHWHFLFFAQNLSFFLRSGAPDWCSCSESYFSGRMKNLVLFRWKKKPGTRRNEFVGITEWIYLLSLCFVNWDLWSDPKVKQFFFLWNNQLALINICKSMPEIGRSNYLSLICRFCPFLFFSYSGKYFEQLLQHDFFWTVYTVL